MLLDGWFIEYCNKSQNNSRYYGGYLKFSDNCMKIYESILSNNFQIIIPLYNAEYDLVRINKKMKIKTVSLIDLKEVYDKIKSLVGAQTITEKEVFVKEILAEVNIRLYHPYDKQDFYIRVLPDNHKLRDLMKIINTLEATIKQNASNTTFIKKIDETNSFIYGKIYLEVRSLLIESIQPGVNAFAVITLMPYEFRTKTSMAIDIQKLNRKSSAGPSEPKSQIKENIKSNSGSKENSNNINNIINASTEKRNINDLPKTNNNTINLLSLTSSNNTESSNLNLSCINANNVNNALNTVNGTNGTSNINVTQQKEIETLIINKTNLNNQEFESAYKNANFLRFEFYQTFVLPIHNKFEKLRIDLYTKNLQGVFTKREIDEKICEHEILIPDIMNNVYFGDKKYQINLENKNKNIKAGKTILNFKIYNHTSILSNFAKIRNKNVLEDMTFEKTEEDLSIKKLFKRLKKILILIKDFKEYYKNLFRFKYPNFSFTIMICSIIYFLFFDLKYFLVHSLFLFFLIAFFQTHYYKKYIACYTNELIFGKKNEFDFPSDFSVMTKNQLEEDEVKKDTYLIDKGEKPNYIKIITEPIKTFKNYRDTYHKVLFKFTRYVSNLEKMKNLFFFTDPLLSIYFMGLLIFAILIIYNIEFRILMLIVIIKKFLTGYSYFKNKYTNNLEIGDIVLKYCHQEYKSKQKISLNLDNKNINNTNENEPSTALFNANCKTNPNDITPANTTAPSIASCINDKTANSGLNPNTNKSTNEFEHVDYKIKLLKNADKLVVSHDIDKVMVFEDKLKLFIKEQLEKHVDLVISNEFLNSISKMGEIKEMIGRCKGMLKIKKGSQLYDKTINNQKIYKESLDADQIFIYFIQNVKSDFYISRYYSFEEEVETE